MCGRMTSGALSFLAALMFFAQASLALPPEGGGPPLPPARQIPGINAPDPFAGGCVSCHLNFPDKRMDARISTLMKQWTEAVPPALLAKAQAATPAGVALKGKHPNVAKALGDIPKACMPCHGANAKIAPRFDRMLHALHLGGGEQSHFMTLFQGECTHCHKLNMATGEWSIPSGPER